MLLLSALVIALGLSLSMIFARAQTVTDYDAVLAPHPAASLAFCEAAPSCAALLEINFNERFARVIRAMQARDAKDAHYNPVTMKEPR
jgi:hypothetical protein